MHKTTVSFMHQAIDMIRQKLYKKNGYEHSSNFKELKSIYNNNLKNSALY